MNPLNVYRFKTGGLITTPLNEFWQETSTGALDPPIPNLPLENPVGAYNLAAASAAFTVNAQAVTLLHAQILVVGAASFAVNAQAVSLLRGTIISTAAAAYTISAQALSFSRTKLILTASTTFTISAQPATLVKITNRSLSLGSASYHFNPPPLTYTFTGLPSTDVTLIYVNNKTKRKFWAAVQANRLRGR